MINPDLVSPQHAVGRNEMVVYIVGRNKVRQWRTSTAILRKSAIAVKTNKACNNDMGMRNWKGHHEGTGFLLSSNELISIR
jgi:hypothetical protein